MTCNRISRLLAFGGAGLLFAVCSDQPFAPTEPSSGGLSAHSHVDYHAPLDPYRINQPPDFMIHSRAKTDIYMQSLVFQPGPPGPWHTHSGPSISIVVQGQIKLQRFTKQEGCNETEVFGPGEAYIKPANEVHRFVVVSDVPVVEQITRFIPFGASITTFVDDPVCPEPS